MDNTKRVAVFIDNSNVFHYIYDIRKSDRSWVCLYNPFILGQKLAGNRNLVYVGFYCVRPPSYLLGGNPEEQKRHNITQKYYGEIEKLPNVSIKFGDLKGGFIRAFAYGRLFCYIAQEKKGMIEAPCQK